MVSEELSRILGYAREEAMRTGAYEISTDHLMLAIIRHNDNNACSSLASMGVDLSDMKHFIESQIFSRSSIPYTDEDKINFSREARGTLNMTLLEASSARQAQAGAAHLLLAISRNAKCISRSYLEIEGINHEALEKNMHETPVPEKRIIHIVVEKPKVFS